MIPLSPEQQKLVEDNIRLAFKFSKRFPPPLGLNHDEWQAECMVFLFHAARRYKPGKSQFSTYAWISMKYGMFDYLNALKADKRDYRKTQRIGEDEDFGFEDFSIRNKIKLEELREQLLVLIKQLPNQLWQEVWLKRMEGKELEEICAEIGLPKSQIKNIYKNGLNFLQTIVERNKIRIAI